MLVDGRPVGDHRERQSDVSVAVTDWRHLIVAAPEERDWTPAPPVISATVDQDLGTFTNALAILTNAACDTLVPVAA